MEYKQKLEHLEFKKANSFLSEQAINFGNKTVVTSAFIILLSLNFLIINGIEIEGIAISMNITIISLVLLIVNIYYYQQFRLYSDVDKIEGIPKDLFNLQNDVKLQANTINEKFKLQEQRKKEINQKFQNSTLKDKEFEELLNELNQMSYDIRNLNETMERSKKEFDKDINKANKYILIAKKYSFLNISIPKVIFHAGLISILFRFIIFVIQIINTQEHPMDYLIENEMKYYKIIFENKDLKK